MQTDELTALIEGVRERVRERHPQGGTAGTVALPDLMPLLHARDAAEAKVAAIGTVNPRAGGPLNWIVQQAKKTVARLLDWHVREQVEFNRDVMLCVQTTLEAFDQMRAALSQMDGLARTRSGEIQNEMRALNGEVQELKDIRAHWAQWRPEWERKLAINETRLLHGVAELNGSFQYRVTQMEAASRDLLKAQHGDYLGALDRSALDIQTRLWADLERIKSDYERLIHTELRLIRQRLAVGPPPAVAAVPAPTPGSTPSSTAAPANPPPAFDYARFAERFRGSEEYVKQGQQFYIPMFAGRREVLDIGCGRGEFLELMRDAQVNARGIDLSAESVELCRRKGLAAEVADLFAYLAALPEGSLDGIFSAQVVEHLPPDRLPEMIRLASVALQRGGLLVIETPDPRCLAIFATHFYLDPTHNRPVPHQLLSFYMEEYGMSVTAVDRRSPAVESLAGLASLPEDFREAFFGGLDYAIVGSKL